jgi:Mg-chelatase subunit ChlD
MKLQYLTYLLVCTLLLAGELRAQTDAGPAPQIEVCFVLDTTGSMSGLIEGAKAKIWSIANQMVAAKPTPKLKLGLVGYRDRSDEYVTRLFDLTDDIDAVYKNLQEFRAAGGGDGPESVNQALNEAVTKINWSPDRSVLKIIFLVGDWPPHMDYPDDVKYPETCQAAVSKDLIINTVQCGQQPDATRVWQEIARLAEGSYVAIGQTGDMQVIATPMDKELAELNAEIGKTLVPYGLAEVRRGVVARQAMSEAAGAPRAADRLAYNASTGKVVQGGGDLVDDLKDGRVQVADLKKDELPVELQKLSPQELQQYVEQKSGQRRQLQARINELLKQRQAHIDSEMQKVIQAGKGNAFDLQVSELIREQGQRKGISYGGAPTIAPSHAGENK